MPIEIDVTPLRSFAGRMESEAPRRPMMAPQPSRDYAVATARAAAAVLDDEAPTLAEIVTDYYYQLIALGMPPEGAASMAAAYQSEAMQGR